MTKRRDKRNNVQHDFLSFTWAGDSMRRWIWRLCMFMLLPPAGVAFFTWSIQGWNADVFWRVKMMTFFGLVIVAFIAVHYLRYYKQFRAKDPLQQHRPRDFDARAKDGKDYL